MNYCPKTSFGDPNTDYGLKENEGGIYAIGINDTKSKNKTQTIKIGQTTSLCKRFYEYHTCFPDGVAIYSILKVPKQRGRPVQGETYSKKLIEIEKLIHAQFKSKKHKQTTRTDGQGEWFDITYQACVKVFTSFKSRGNLVIFDP